MTSKPPPTVSPSEPSIRTWEIDDQTFRRILDNASPVTGQNETPPAVGRQPFRNLPTQLSQAELAETGTQKLILDLVARTDLEVESLRPFVERFHAADRELAVARHQLNANKGMEIGYTVGIGAGFLCFGVIPSFSSSMSAMLAAGFCGFLLVAGSIAMKWFSK